MKQLGAFAAGVKQMLEDVQERLVYRTHIYIQTDILGYKPAPGDLAYPAKLEMMEVRGGGRFAEENKAPSRQKDDEPGERSWYIRAFKVTL